MHIFVSKLFSFNTSHFPENCGETEATPSTTVTAVRVDDQVIVTNGAVVSAAQEKPEYSEQVSVCSCSCYNLRSGMLPSNWKLSRNTSDSRGRTEVVSSSQGRFIKPNDVEERISITDESTSVPLRDVCNRKRASIWLWTCLLPIILSQQEEHLVVKKDNSHIFSRPFVPLATKRLGLRRLFTWSD